MTDAVETIQDGLWRMDHPLRMPGGVSIGTRSTLVRLADESLLLHAPGPMTGAQLEGVRALGSVSRLVAPNAFHNLFVEAAVAHFPDAQLHAVPSVQKKYPALPSVTLGEAADPAWKGVLEQVAVAGAPRLDEVVFFHPASATLLLVDLCFNMQRADNLRTRIFMTLMSAYGRFGPSRLARSMFKDKAAVRASVDRILEWDFDRAIVTHGDIVETGAREALRESFGWLKG